MKFTLPVTPVLAFMDELEKLQGLSKRTVGYVWFRPDGEVSRDGDTAKVTVELDRLEEQWRALDAGVRQGLSRLVMLHPTGDVVIYRVP